jgi:hypothetical protein
MHARTHAFTRLHMLTHVHEHTYTHAHAHAHARTHTHTQHTHTPLGLKSQASCDGGSRSERQGRLAWPA